jgi:secreted PhoX family phosphatase
MRDDPMHDFDPAHGYSDGDVDTNNTEGSAHLNEIVAERYSRRQTLLGGLRASSAAFLGATALAACDWFDDSKGGSGGFVVQAGSSGTTTAGNPVTLSGAMVAGSAASVRWTQTGGPPVELAGADTDKASFIAPAVAAGTALQFTFEATGGNGQTSSQGTTVTVNPAVLGFNAVQHSLADVVVVPAGYQVTVMTRLGDPLAAGVPAYANDGSDTDFARRIGDHGDALHWFGLSDAGARDEGNSVHGLLVQNHENLNIQYLHPNGPTNASAGPRPAAEAQKEIEAHGVSVTEYRDAGDRSWSYVQDSAFNRRITPNTPVVFNGPARGSDLLKTVGDTGGTAGSGTINNCANGHSGWGTNLTCEENWAGYFRRTGDDAARTPRELTALRRYGVTTAGNFAWSTAGGDPMFARWDARATGASATADYRNEPNKMGWVLEIDPYDPGKAPRKRTALGRLGHEGAWLGRLADGQKVAVYMGDDSRGEYLYKFVSNAAWNPADAQAADRLAVGDKYLDAGTLYVARFNADGTGAWLPLTFGAVPNRPASGSDPEYGFTDQADILVNARLAADAVGATPMDRPEWTAVNPVTGEVYLTLTNNTESGRPLDGTDAANPRHYNDPKGASSQFGNPNGHIIRLRENGDNGAATGFAWDIYLFGADAAEADPANVNLSGLTADNDFSSPDGLWFSRAQNPAGQVKPLLWIQTDDGALTDRTNCMMLAAMPGTVGDGGARTITNVGSGGATATQATRTGSAATAATLKRFLVGPKECEITGVDSTPDGRTLFVGIQHPGELGTPAAPSSNWPQSQAGNASGRPRSAVVAITRTDGGVIGL